MVSIICFVFHSSETFDTFSTDCGCCNIFVDFHQFVDTNDMENASKFQTEKELLQQYIDDISNIPTIAYRNFDTNTSGKSYSTMDLRNVVWSLFNN